MKRKLKIFAACFMALALAVGFAACGDKETGGDDNGGDNGGSGDGRITMVSRLCVDLSDDPMPMPYFVSGEEGTVEWSVDSPSVAAVTEDGTLYPVAIGTAVVTAKMGGSYAECEVEVTDYGYDSYTELSTAEDVIELIESGDYAQKNKKYCLTNDIDFAGQVIQPMGGWQSDAFKATFDGRGYALKNFRIENPESCKTTNEDTGADEYFGVSLFPYINGGTVRNLALIGVNYTSFGFTGGIAGQLENGTIENCFVQGVVKADPGTSSNVPSGGICGIMGAGAVVKNCFMDLDVVGGYVFAGFNFGTGSNCVARKQSISYIAEGHEDMLFEAITTGKPGDAGLAEDAELEKFDKDNTILIEETQLTSLRNYSFSERGSNWAIYSGYMAFVARPDGSLPDWAKIA